MPNMAQTEKWWRLSRRAWALSGNLSYFQGEQGSLDIKSLPLSLSVIYSHYYNILAFHQMLLDSKAPPGRWSLRESSFAETFYWKVLIWRLSVTEKLVAEGKHDAIYSCVYNSLTFGNSSQLQHLVSMSSYNRISLATELLRRIPGHVWKCSCNEPLVPFYLCALKVWRAYTEGSVRLNMFQPSGNWKVIIIQR